MSALRAYPRLRHGENLRAWLYTIAHRKATDAVRRLSQPAVERRRWTGCLPAASRASRRIELADDGVWAAGSRAPRASSERRWCIGSCMDLDYRSIGELMGTSEEAARQNVSAGLQRLRKEMDR